MWLVGRRAGGLVGWFVVGAIVVGGCSWLAAAGCLFRLLLRALLLVVFDATGVDGVVGAYVAVVVVVVDGVVGVAVGVVVDVVDVVAVVDVIGVVAVATVAVNSRDKEARLQIWSY